MRLIDADALKEHLSGRYMTELYPDWCELPLDVREKIGLLGSTFKQAILNAPTIEAEPVRNGRWEWHEYWGNAAFQDPPEPLDSGWRCSECGINLLDYLVSHFPDIPSYVECASFQTPTLERCPNCGATIDAKEEDE